VCVDTAIKGLTVGVATMKRHEVAVLRCRPEYAYGQAGKPPHIPANATLIFEVELLDFFGKFASELVQLALFKT
jgi:FKBP-type peptidyl-prolyl cis-trans isomerase